SSPTLTPPSPSLTLTPPKTKELLLKSVPNGTFVTRIERISFVFRKPTTRITRRGSPRTPLGTSYAALVCYWCARQSGRTNDRPAQRRGGATSRRRGAALRRQYGRLRAGAANYSRFAPDVADAFDSYDVFVDSKKFTSWRVSFAAAIHFAGFDTLYSASKPSSSSLRSARYFTYWLM
ncbi:MAG: hypothetical protein JWQ47_2497, partial [Glaciihabitans sp.]|nr:hypothetical protein [Glaciihabitans sp.]